MVLLTVTPAVKTALEAYDRQHQSQLEDAATLNELQVGEPIEHSSVVKLSRALLRNSKELTSPWHLDTLLRGISVYRPPPPPKAEPSAEYKALMQKLRKDDEERQYERMTSVPASKKSFASQTSTTPVEFNPMLSHGYNDSSTLDEATYQDIDRQLTLIINVLVTVIASGVTIWFAARHWPVPQRLALSLTGSFAIAIAEVVVYTGYIRRLKEAKAREKKKVEHKEVTNTWIIQPATTKTDTREANGIRHRKGKHR